ncbi:MAG: hypothetical protein COW88_02335 [Candidatus Lloydbacteria bacterium CG22_combo_CG10-13_8_21_14_all_47_15]|uniref:C4-dicarboxylate ABC transporter substrate-binding protein n=1 Tax=Candidatus Lloydbacteria bacterium CG22_combo_CG10-13_8_21_14_all_47_15 TaxID=1974635 RepID=A0A2H0CTS5_9BACT|nr:MAG: hypothetical protein COW88_02335 [Candidatus Lloydbacteria bacterium CG22_combo_CG10-13_8_21_14_all_47_15]
MNNKLIILIVIILAVGAGFYVYSDDATAKDDAIKIRLLVAHQPVSVFERSNEIFAKELLNGSNGTMELEVLSPSDFGYETDIPLADVYELMDSGQIDISTAITSAFQREAPRSNVFLMPFLFSNYDSLVGFLDSDEAKEILSDITSSTRVTALAFTFSGGFRVIALHEEGVDSEEDLSGKTIASLGDDITKSALSHLGVEVVSISEASDLSALDGTEVAYTRFAQLDKPTTMRSIVETGHSALVTTLIINDAIYDSLTTEQKNALMESAQTAAKAERADSKSLADKTRSELLENGASIVALSDERRHELRDANNSLYTSFESEFGMDLLDRNL